MYPKKTSGKARLGLRLSVAVGVLMACACQPCLAGPGESESQLSYTAAKRDLAKGDTATALIELKNAVRADPANSDARYELATLYLSQGNAAGALSELETARSRGYDNRRILPLLAQTYGALGRYKDVAKIPVDGLNGDQRAAVLAAQARAQVTLNDLPSARHLADEALAASPKLTNALVASAMVFAAEGKYAEAEAQVEKARSDGDQAELLILKGDLRQKQNDSAGAAKYLDLAVAKYPSNVEAHVERAMVNVTQNKTDAVREDVAWVLARQPQQPYALFLKAYLQAEDKNYREASQILMALPDLTERYAPALYLLAETTLQDGRAELALGYAQHYRSKVPDDTNGVRLLARVEQRMKQPDRAVALLEPLVARTPDVSKLKLQLAGALLEAGRSDEAVKLFQQGLNADPANTDAHLALAVGQLRTGKTDQAIDQIENALRSDPDSLQAKTLLLLTHLQLNPSQKAKSAAAAMVAANGNDPNVYNLQGTVYLSTGELKTARADFQAALQKDPLFMPAVLNLARVEERSGNWPAAQMWYEKAVAIDPVNLTAHQGLANLALRNGNVDGATAYLKRAVARDATAMEARLQLINVLLDAKRYPPALIEARDFVNAAPKSPQALDALGRAQIANGDIEGGLTSYQRLAAQNPDNAEAQRRLGQALMTAPPGNSKERYLKSAVAAFDDAVKVAPDDTAALGDRIELERRIAGSEAALSLAEKYAADRPESVSRLIVLGDAQLVAHQAAAASSTYRRAWDKSKTSATALRMYTGLTEIDKSDEALKLVTAWTASHPTDYAARFVIANHYLKAGKTAEAIAETEAISAVYPDNAALLNNLAWLYAQTNPAKALEFAERAYVLAPESADVLDTLGWLRVSHADVSGGEAVLRQAHTIAPERADIGFHYAVALDRNNKTGDARKVLERTLAHDQMFSERAQAQALFQKLSTVQ